MTIEILRGWGVEETGLRGWGAEIEMTYWEKLHM